ncbi:MAG: Rpn family recombination-promoting nuclease/putative transposase [Oscillospiraceae bacterium]|jgi:predicted transposase/invertase (TIGR01784 family)|nr:Rpn family recombination-promoting nuclease/putative transposase [Oscillospiraceae bacterium]
MSADFLPPKSDIVFKLLFGDERNIDLLTALLKSVLDLPHSEYAEVTIVDPHLLREFETDKLGILDVKVTTKSGNIIDIEIQVAETPELKERIIFYIAKMITEQIGNGQDYDAIKHVVSIVITDFDFIVGSEPYHHKYTLYDRENESEFTDLVSLHTLELPKLPSKDDDTELYDWLRFIRAETEEDLNMSAQTNTQIEKAVGVLKELSADERARMLYDAREKQRRDEASRLKGALREGEARGKLEVAKNAIKAGIAIDQITLLTGLSREEIERLQK